MTFGGSRGWADDLVASIDQLVFERYGQDQIVFNNQYSHDSRFSATRLLVVSCSTPQHGRA
jgi:hypothetical protein